MKKIKILNIVGARPNFMKIAPLMKEMEQYPNFDPILLHTGQHYDDEMSNKFFSDMGLPDPHIYLGVGSGTHAEQTAKIMLKFEKVLLKENPDLVIVVGDVNSTIACTITASKLNISVAHIEAGLRSFDRTMPEEINRIVTDSLAEHLFTTCEDANENLIKEGIPESKIFFVGNVMIDTLLMFKKKAEALDTAKKLGVDEKYALLTLHRPSNVDIKDSFEKVLSALFEIQDKITIVFPAHPRTLKQIKEFGIDGKIKNMKNFKLINPLGYLDFFNLMINSLFVITDSGGIQEETTALGIPCLTVRENTERPVTVREGTNRLVGNDPDKIINESMQILSGKWEKGNIPKFWDGKAAERIVKYLIK